MSRPSKPLVILATWFGSGFLPLAPGTWGTLAGMPVALLIAWQAGAIFLALAAGLLFLCGVRIAGTYARTTGKHDPQEVVIDEVAAMWLVLAAVPVEPLAYTSAFLLFRFFDIVKLWPIGLIERQFDDGMGIMLDDIVAAIYSVAGLSVLQHVGAW